MSVLEVGYDVLKTAVNATTKCISALVGHMNGEGKTLSKNVEWWQHVGFISLPSEADADKKEAAKVVLLRLGNYDIAIASRDKRGQELAGAMKPGETCIYAAGADGKGQARSLYKGDGSISHFTRVGNDAAGKAMMIQMDPASDEITIVNSVGNGIKITPDGVKILAGEGASGKFMTSGEVSIIGTAQTQVDGATLLFGSAGVPGINSALMGPTGLVGVANPKIILGT